MDKIRTTNETVIPVVAEELEIGKRQVDTGGGIRVHKTVTETHHLVDEPMLVENAEVTRMPINRIVASAPPTRHEGDITIVSIVEEQLVIEKRLVLKEEIHIRKSRQRISHPQTVTLREEHAQVERFGQRDERVAREEGTAKQPIAREQVVREQVLTEKIGNEQPTTPAAGSILNRVFPPKR